MDPTTVLPPSPEKSPPPQNPHTATDAIDSDAFDRHQNAEASTSRNMDNFRALVMKLAGRLLPAHQSLIGRRFDDIFPDELLVPDHPPYADMILTALWELNTEGGSSEEAISDFIEKEYHELPWAHATMLNYHLRDLCMKGKIVMTCDRCYLRCCSSITTKPVPSPSLCLDDDDDDDSSCSSSYSSSSASLCSSPTSSSSSFCPSPPYERPKRQLKRKNIKESGCKMVQVHGRGRGRQLRTIRVGQRGGSLGMSQARRQGKPRDEIKIGEKSQMEQERAEKQKNQPQKKNNEVVEAAFSVEDQTKVIIDPKVGGGEWNGNVKEKGESVGLRRSGRMKIVVDEEEENLPCEQYKVGTNEQYQPQKQYNVTWIGRGEHIQGKGECVKQKQSGSKQHVSKEPFQPCEQHEEGVNERGHQRKQYNVVWIGRGVRKLKGAGKNLLDQQLTELEEDYICKDAVMINCDAEVDEHVEQLEPKEEHNRPEENQQSDFVEKQLLDKEQLMSVTDDKVLPCKQHERMDTGAEIEVAEKLQLKHQLWNEVHPETLQVDDKIKEDQYLLMARSKGQEVGVIKEWNGKHKQVEGESIKQIGSQNHLSGEQVDLQKQSKEETDSKFHAQGQPQRPSTEQDQLQKQEDRLGDEQDSAMMQCEAKVIDASVEKQHDDTIEEQPKKGTKELFETHEQQNGGGTEQKMLEIQVQMVGKPLQYEGIQKGRALIDEEREAHLIQYEVQARVETVEKTEREEQHNCLTEEQVDTKEQSKEHHDDATEPIYPQELCIERTEEELQSCGPDWLKNAEAESAEEQPQQEEQQTEVNQKEIGLAMDSEVQQGLRMNPGETKVGRECVIRNESEEQQHVAEKHVQPQEHCMVGNRFQLHKQQQRDVMEQVHLEREVEVAEDEHREEQLNKVKEKDSELMHGNSNCLHDLVMTQTEAEVEGDSEEHNKSEVYQDQLEKLETVTSQVQPQQDGQHKKVLQEESELMNNLTAVRQDFTMIESGSQLEMTSVDVIESGSQLERTSVEHNEVQEDDIVVGKVQPQKQSMEGTKEGQKDENEAGFEKNLSKECENGVTVQRYQPQEQCVERIEERSQPCIQQNEGSEKDACQEKNNAANNENLASSSSTIEVSGALSCKSLGDAKANLPDHKHQDEQRRPLRQGLRSSCKKEEATRKAKNQLERATPVRRSLRPRKTISEATVVIENGPDHSKEQLKHSGRARPSKRKPGIAEAEQASKSQKTRRTGL